MGIIYKSNIQTIVNGCLIGVGVYDEEHISAAAKDLMESYCATQRMLPLGRRQIPPYFEIIDDGTAPASLDDKLERYTDSYMGKTKRELVDLCKQRGLEVPKKANNADLVSLLVNDDRNKLESDESAFIFKSDEEFVNMSAQEQVQYLDSIFALPDNIEENSNEEAEYMNILENTITMYGNLSLEEETLTKIREMLHYINGGANE